MTGANRNRIRKLECEDCGYVARVSRACLLRGLPGCPCGSPLRPTDPGDLIAVGLLELDELPRPLRTQLCREMGWEQEIVRTSPAQQPGSRRRGLKRRRTLDRLPF